MKILKYVFLCLYIFTFGYHCVSSLQTAEESSSISMDVTEVVVEIEENVFHHEVTDIEKVHNNVRKIVGHFMYFGLIGTFGFLTFYCFFRKLSKTVMFSAPIGFLMAIVSEVLQNFTDGRGPSVKDVFIDYAGYLVATLVLLLIFYLVIRNKNKKTKEGVE